MTLLAKMLHYKFVEKLYPATLVGIQYKCEQSDSGIAFDVTSINSFFMFYKSKSIIFQVFGFNQKMHLVFDIFSKTLISLPNGPTGKQFNVFVQQQFDIYEKEILDPSSIAEELHLSVIQSQYHPLWEKYKRLRSISFLEFEQFCRSFCEEVKMQALVHGNIDKDYATNIIKNILNDFQCKRIQNVSIKYA